MALKTRGKINTIGREFNLLDIVMSGEAARMCGVDRRTFMRRVNNKEIEPLGKTEGRLIFKKEDVLRLAKKLKKEKEEK